ncbi:MAG: glycosyltransferase [Butyrivibrio sp.]|jgi:glycosyltransferase involved in cell wall biosynthesis|nr:glycosyltransferase [Butyrivibrio sp.]
MNDLISIIIPIYNTENYLQRCIGSVVNQTYKKIEIILVDDGSSDRSLEICNEYKMRDSRVRVIHNEHRGSINARKCGLCAAEGVYAGFVDSDDWVDADMYEILYSGCINGHSEMTVCKMMIETNEFSYVKRSFSVKDGTYSMEDIGALLTTHFYAADADNGVFSGAYCDKLVKRDLLYNNLMCVEDQIRGGEDSICIYPTTLSTRKISFINKALYHYRQRKQSMLHGQDEQCFMDINAYYLYMKKKFSESIYANILLNKLKQYVLRVVLDGINYRFGFSDDILVPNYVPPYKELLSKGGHNIILYGAGKVGRDYMEFFRLVGVINVIAWVDKDYDGFTKAGLNVESPKVIDKYNYDMVLIAVVNEKIADEIRDELIEEGVEKQNILFVYPKSIVSECLKKLT